MKTRVYTLERFGWKITAPERGCLFCDHCTDIFYDEHGVYDLWCDANLDVQAGARGECDAWTGEEEDQSDAG